MLQLTILQVSLVVSTEVKHKMRLWMMEMGILRGRVTSCSWPSAAAGPPRGGMQTWGVCVCVQSDPVQLWETDCVIVPGERSEMTQT